MHIFSNHEHYWNYGNIFGNLEAFLKEENTGGPNKEYQNCQEHPPVIYNHFEDKYFRTEGVGSKNLES